MTAYRLQAILSLDKVNSQSLHRAQAGKRPDRDRRDRVHADVPARQAAEPAGGTQITQRGLQASDSSTQHGLQAIVLLNMDYKR